jgi:hypothetical protein
MLACLNYPLASDLRRLHVYSIQQWPYERVLIPLDGPTTLLKDTGYGSVLRYLIEIGRMSRSIYASENNQCVKVELITIAILCYNTGTEAQRIDPDTS